MRILPHTARWILILKHNENKLNVFLNLTIFINNIII
jgi:hypothetical protein